jgi:NTE family protein
MDAAPAVARALVLGAGGPVGIAWEAGVLVGLLERGVDVRLADLIVGTSAGSVVGARVADGSIIVDDLERLSLAPPAPKGGFDLAGASRVFAHMRDARLAPEARIRAIVSAARGVRTVEPETWIHAMQRAHGVEAWPLTALAVVAADAESGARKVFRAGDAPLPTAIAASCAVPGLLPPIFIAGRGYLDGALYSSTNADLAAFLTHAHAIVVAPISSHTAPYGDRAEAQLSRECAALEHAGARVDTVVANADDAEAIGKNLMDASRASSAYEAGLCRGRALAEALENRW